jgi:hypothetical protein
MFTFDAAKSDSWKAHELGSDHLGNNVYVSTKGDAGVYGQLKGIRFSEFRVDAKHGRVFDVLLDIGNLEELRVAADSVVLVEKA